MELLIRAGRPADAAELTTLALRSKAHWGYDEAFMAAVRDELSYEPSDAADDFTLALGPDGRVIGFSRVTGNPPSGELEALFVDPAHIGAGIGTGLLHLALDRARAAGFADVLVDSDPFAEGFYSRLGAVRIGSAPSGSIPGRSLPRMRFEL